MKIRLFAAVAVCLNFALGANAADDVKEIELKGLKADVPMLARPDKPTEIKTAEELEKTFPQKEVVENIKKSVDFGKQKLLFFAWAGSGQDSLSFKADKGNVAFTYQPGRTRDLRPHFHLYAIPKDAKWTLGKGK